MRSAAAALSRRWWRAEFGEIYRIAAELRVILRLGRVNALDLRMAAVSWAYMRF